MRKRVEDRSQLHDLTERQKLVLALVVRDHIESARPVGSVHLIETYDLALSSATVRNEMVALTEMGYLRQPHTSAGRVPSEEGYRYFVRQLMGNNDLPVTTQRTIVHQFYQAGFDMDRWMRLAASVLAHQAQAASLVTAPYPLRAEFRHVELISTRGRQVLMVLVLAGGEVRQQMLALAEPVAQEQLSATAQRLNDLCQGMDGDGVARLSETLPTLEQEVVRLIADEMARTGAILAGEVYRDGLTHVLGEPEFGEVEIARNALRVLEERSLLEDLITRTVFTEESGGVQVLIGGEGTWEELRDCTVVLARYGAPGMASGALGVLGPIRMPYGRNVSTVRFMARLLSDLVEGIHTD
jgi:heat-inducible transcriptional repressor